MLSSFCGKRARERRLEWSGPGGRATSGDKRGRILVITRWGRLENSCGIQPTPPTVAHLLFIIALRSAECRFAERRARKLHMFTSAFGLPRDPNNGATGTPPAESKRFYSTAGRKRTERQLELNDYH